MAEPAQVIDFQQARAKRRARAEEAWVSKQDVARHRGVSTRTINRYMKRGLPFVKKFEHSFPQFQLSAVDEWWEANDA